MINDFVYLEPDIEENFVFSMGIRVADIVKKYAEVGGSLHPDSTFVIRFDKEEFDTILSEFYLLGKLFDARVKEIIN